MYSNVTQVKITAEIQYTSFLELYAFVSTIEFMMLILLMPALTAGAVSGERERQTLDIMMTTMVTAKDVVIGKLFSALAVMFLVIISSFPVTALVFVYGGISWMDIGTLILCYIVSALFAGSIGICCSAFLRSSTVSTVVSYIAVGAIVVGTYAVNMFVNQLALMNMANNNHGLLEEVIKETGSGGFLYLLLFNPSATFLMILFGQTSTTGPGVESWFGIREPNFVTENWPLVSMAVQLAAACVFVYIAIKAVSPERRKNKNA